VVFADTKNTSISKAEELIIEDFNDNCLFKIRVNYVNSEEGLDTSIEEAFFVKPNL
jgi:hypothetical protein